MSLERIPSFTCNDVPVVTRLKAQLELRFLARILYDSEIRTYTILPQHCGNTDELRNIRQFMAGVEFADGRVRRTHVRDHFADYYCDGMLK